MYIAVMFSAFLLLAGCSQKASRSVTSLSQLKEKGRSLGVSGSSPQEAYMRKDFPDAEIRTYTEIIPAYSEVANGKLDACFEQRHVLELAMENGLI